MHIKPCHQFAGLRPFIERAAEGRLNPYLGRCESLWHCKQIQDALGQLPKLDSEARRALLAHVRSVRDAFAVALAGVDLAIAETTQAVERSDARGPKRSPSRAKRS